MPKVPENKPNLPTHLGLILDGNRRWAKDNNLPTFEGHRIGAEVFKTVALGAFDKGIKYLSAWVFSTENWKRSQEEVKYLMNLAIKATEKYLDEFHTRGIKILIFGERSGLSKAVVDAIVRTEQKTANNTRGTLVLCFNYGGHQEIVSATKKLIDQNIPSDKITTEVFRSAIYGPEVPDVDFLVRTSGEERTSGYMLWRSTYSELMFVKKYWPDFTLDDLEDALKEFAVRSRRFGG